MKKVICILTALLSALCLSPTVFAAETVSFSVDNVTCENNRLIEVPVRAQSAKPLSAALFTFTYSASVLEFRGADAPKGSAVVFNETAAGVKLSYLCEQGAEIASFDTVFTLKFKSVGTGSTAIDYEVYDCVDADVGQMDIGSCTAGSVTVEGASPVSRAASRRASGNSGSTTSGGTGSKKAKRSSRAASSSSRRTSKEEKEEESGGFGVIIQESDKTTPLVVFIASTAIAVVFITFLIFKMADIWDRKREKRKKHENTAKNDEENNNSK